MADERKSIYGIDFGISYSEITYVDLKSFLCPVFSIKTEDIIAEINAEDRNFINLYDVISSVKRRIERVIYKSQIL